MSDYIINTRLNSITYILPTGDQKDCWLVDCGDVEKVIDAGLNVKGVLLTHAHYDHCYGLNKLMQLFPKAVIYTTEEGKEALYDPRKNFSKYHDEIEDFIFDYEGCVITIDYEGELQVDEHLSVDIILTPGHDVSCISYRVGNNIYTGDSYIPNCKLVCTFPRSNRKLAKENEQRLKDLEASGMKIMPGHWIENK